MNKSFWRMFLAVSCADTLRFRFAGVPQRTQNGADPSVCGDGSVLDNRISGQAAGGSWSGSRQGQRKWGETAVKSVLLTIGLRNRSASCRDAPVWARDRGGAGVNSLSFLGKHPFVNYIDAPPLSFPVYNEFDRSGIPGE